MSKLYELQPLACEIYHPLDCKELPYSSDGSIKTRLENKFIFFRNVDGKKEDFLQQATDGDIISQRQLGRIYCRDHNHEEGRKWLRKAADNNDTIAQYLLGCSYCSTQNLDLAIQWYEKAANNNNTDAEYLLGRIHYFCADYEEAIKWYKKLAEKNISWAERELGAMFFFGEPSRTFTFSGPVFAYDEPDEPYIGRNGYCSQENYIKSNLQEAVRWFKKAASHGNRNALLNLGLIYFHRYHDYTQAREYWKKAADNGDFASAYYLGKYSFHDKDIDSVKYLSQVILSGNVEGKCELGLFYDPLYRETYDSTNYNDLKEQAKYWYEKAAKEDNTKAKILYGNLLYSEKNYNEALKYYTMAFDDLLGKAYDEELEYYYTMGINDIIEKDFTDKSGMFLVYKETIPCFVDNNYIEFIHQEAKRSCRTNFTENFIINTGKILYHQGKLDDAFRKWRTAIDCSRSPRAYQLIADYYYKDANCEEIVKQFTKNKKYTLSYEEYYEIALKLNDYKNNLTQKIDFAVRPAAIKFTDENCPSKTSSLIENWNLIETKVTEYREKFKEENNYQKKLEDYLISLIEEETKEEEIPF